MGSRIRVLRDEKRLMQLDMAREMGISVSLLSRIENGLEKLTVDNLLKLCRFLNVSADRILGLERPE
jgi:transcriptional regulator with XRE-family HTH domain